MKKKILLLWVLLSTAVCTFAYDYDFKSGDLYYNFTRGGNTVEVTYQYRNSFDNYSGLTSVIIPESVTYDGSTYSVTSIGEWAFQYCSGLTSVTIPNSVTSIGCGAFSHCWGLTSVTIPNGVTSIEGHAFGDCSGLTSITIPNSVTSIGEWAFYGCWGLTSVTIPNSVTSIGDDAFYNCSGLTSVTIPNSVTSIGDDAFYNCRRLTSITIPNSVTYIGESAFMETPWYDNWYNNQPNGMVYINRVLYAYKGTMPQGTNIIVKEGTTSICSGVFKDCTGLTSITIPNSVTSIGSSAFYGCSRLNSITIPNSVTSIGSSAFSGCSGLTSITFKPITPPIIVDRYSIFYHCPIEYIYIPCGTKTAYITVWSDEWNFTEVVTQTISANTEDAAKGTAHVDQQASCDNNKTAIISATPAEHYRFAQWNDGNTDNPRTIVVTEDATYTAEFIPIRNITVVYDVKQGYVSGDGIYDLGTRVRSVAEPNSGYKFLQWSDGTAYNPYIFAATEDVTLEALFIPTTAVESVKADKADGVQKVLRDGQIYILRNGKAYDIVGREVEF